MTINPAQSKPSWPIITSVFLALFSVAVGLIFLVEYFTRDKILANQAASELAVLSQVLNQDSFDNELLYTYFEVENQALLNHVQPMRLYQAQKAGKVTAIVIPTIAPDGYQGRIHILVGISALGELIKVRIISHMETPGLGNQIHQGVTDWVKQFSGLSLANTPETAWGVKTEGGQFDQFSGATVSPRAVVEAVHRTLLYFHENQSLLLQPL